MENHATGKCLKPSISEALKDADGNEDYNAGFEGETGFRPNHIHTRYTH